MSEVWKYSRATGADLLVMLALADFPNDQGESYPSLKTIAQKARLSVRGVCKILERRQAAGEIRRDRSKGGKNRRTRYFIKLPNSEQHSENGIQRMAFENGIQRTAYSEPDDTQTVNGGSHAINRHRTVDKDVSKKPHAVISKTEIREPKNSLSGFRQNINAALVDPTVSSGPKRSSFSTTCLKR